MDNKSSEESELHRTRVEAHDHRVLKDKITVITRASFWKIPHDSGKNDVRLKIGRYNKKIEQSGFVTETLENNNPKSELTLDDDEFKGLIDYISEKYEPFRLGIKKYVSLDDSFSKEGIEFLRAIFENKDKKQVLQQLINNRIVPEDFIKALSSVNKLLAIREFEKMLKMDLSENQWQPWFKKNDWVLGSDYVNILDDRNIDTRNIADYLMQAYDGFLDVIEIKRPGGGLQFWADGKDHNNYYPSMALIKAITQSYNYIHEVELEANSDKFIQRMNGIRAIKPRCVLIFGRSENWDEEQKKSYRMLNCNYQNITILTYDHVLNRAKKILDDLIEISNEST
jgi:hypothetical protein